VPVGGTRRSLRAGAARPAGAGASHEQRRGDEHRHDDYGKDDPEINH
jgi:hypothetical protein